VDDGDDDVVPRAGRLKMADLENVGPRKNSMKLTDQLAGCDNHRELAIPLPNNIAIFSYGELTRSLLFSFFLRLQNTD